MSRKIGSLVVALFLSLSSAVLYAQGGAVGTILGTVTDSSGAVVADADVTVTNVATNVAHSTKTTGSGDYTVPFLAPGSYKVAVEAKGFQKGVVDNITLVVAQQARANVTLKAGSTSEVVEVQASAIALDTDSAALSQTITQKQVDQLPLANRNFISLIFLTPGAVETNGEQGTMRQGAGNAISINGSRPESNNYTLDGIANVDTALGTPAVILSQDAIQEFKIQSGTYSAEYGFSANQVNIISKSGTNSLHGTVFDFIRNDAFDAFQVNPNQPAPTRKPELRQNQFGFVLGGPIYIPKLYDGRNKTFFLVNYEGQRTVNGFVQNFIVPTPAMLNGDFSNATILNGPNVGQPLPARGTAACTAELSAGRGCMPIDPTTGAAFPGNIIPTASFSKIANVTHTIFPSANSANNVFNLATALPNNIDQQTYKLDQNLGKWGSIFFRWTNVDFTNQNINGSASIPAGQGVFVQNNKSWTISHTIPLTHNMVNNFRFGHLEAISNQGGVAMPTDQVSALGLTGVFTDIPDSVRTFPGLVFQGGLASAGSQVNDATTSDIPMWDFSDALTIIHGKHSLSVGFDYRTWVQKRNLSNDFLGQWTYNNDTISNNGAGCTNATGLCGTGNAIADYLLGYYNNVTTFQPGPFAKAGAPPGNLNQFHFMYFAPYVQDDWKVTNRLTLNLGLRWDYRNVPTEKDNKMFWFDNTNPRGGLCYADKTLGTADVPGLGGPIAPDGNGFYRYCGRNNPADGSKKPFAPRIGFAFRLTDKTVLRGGYGIFFDSTETREIDNSGDIYPNVVRVSDNATQNAALPKLTDNMIVPTVLHQVIPDPVTGAYVDGSQFFAVLISDHPQNPYTQNWTFSVQRELSKNTTLEANYVGNKGTHLLNRTNINQPFAAADPTICDPRTGGSLANCPIQARRPYQNITAGPGFLDSLWNGFSNYHAGNLKLEHRTGNAVIAAIYTYSKSLDDKSAAAGVGAQGGGFSGHLNDHDQALDYGRSEFDTRHRFVASYVYSLPFGRGKRFGGNMNRALDAAVGGWQVGGVTTFQQGFPFSVTAPDQGGILNAFSQRADLVAGCDPTKGFSKSIHQWFNTSCFTAPLAGAFGNSGRNILTQPGINNWDMNLGKTFTFTERVSFQFRAEAFNVFNHTQYGVNPNVGGAASSIANNVANTGVVPFGAIQSARPARVMQLGGKLVF